MKHMICVLALIFAVIMISAQTIQPGQAADQYSLHLRLDRTDGRPDFGTVVSFTDQDGRVIKPAPVYNINGFSSFDLAYGKYTLRCSGYRDHDIYVLPFLTNIVIMSEQKDSDPVQASNTYLALSDMIVQPLGPVNRKFYSWAFLSSEESEHNSQICLINSDRFDDLSTGLSFLAELRGFCVECNSFAYKRKLRLNGADDPSLSSVKQLGDFGEPPILIRKVDKNTAELTTPADPIDQGVVKIDSSMEKIMDEIVAETIDIMFVTIVDGRPVIVYSSK